MKILTDKFKKKIKKERNYCDSCFLPNYNLWITIRNFQF